MKTIRIYRNYWDSVQTLGNCTVLDEDGKPLVSAISLERAWKDNEPQVSCIPAGDYQVKLEYSERFKKDLWEIKGVPNRSECKFHSANYYSQLQGCIALGDSLGDINHDGNNDVLNSKLMLKTFHSVFGNDTEALLKIR